MVRRSVLSLVENPVRNAIVLPSSQCEDIKELIRLQRNDDYSFYHCFERDSEIREDMIHNLDYLNVNYKSYADILTSNLRDILQGEQTNFVNLDLCGMLTTKLFNWLYFNFKVDRENILTDDAFVSINLSMTKRGGTPFFYYEKESVPTKTSYHIKRNPSNFEQETIPEIYNTLAYIFDHDVFMSEQTIYQSNDAKLTMSTSTFMLGE